MKTSGSVIVVALLQGFPRVVTQEDGDPHTWESIEEAVDWCNSDKVCLAVEAAEAVTVVDVATGDTEAW